MAVSLPWFGVWSSRKPLEQGVIIPDFKFPDLKSIPFPNKSKKKGTLKYVVFDAIVLSQSCDLAGKSIPYIHICPVDKLSEMFKEDPNKYQTPKSREKELEKLQEGRYTNLYVTNKYTAHSYNRLRREKPKSNLSYEFNKFKNDRLVVDFRESAVVSSEYLRKFTKSGVLYMSLNPPYREAMAQKYGLYFMRVGNPINYTKYKDSDYSLS